MKKIREVLLVDDGRGTNALNKRLLVDMGVVEKVSTVVNGQLALDYLTTKNEDDQYPTPDVIFLDINMPVMDGYQFLNHYNDLETVNKSKMSIFMLTTSVSKADMEKATSYSTVKGYQIKPLTKEKINDIINQVI